MFKKLSGFAICAATLLALGHSGDAAAQSTWNIGTTCDPSPAQTAFTAGGNTLTCNVGSPVETLTMTAYSNTGAGGVFARGSLGDFGTSGVGVYSASGESGTDSQHSFDNLTTGCGGTTGTCGGSQEFALVNFGPKKVSLTSIAIGYRATDADVSLLRWDGADQTAAQMSALIGARTTSNLHNGVGTSTGWTLVANESMNDATPDTSSVALGNKVSSWWIISTYYGVSAGATNLGTLDTGNDRFKLSAITGAVCASGVYSGGNQGNGGTCTTSGAIGVPEPTSLALVGLALLGGSLTRRRRA